MTNEGRIQILQATLNRSCQFYKNAVRTFETAFRQHEANYTVDGEQIRLAARARVMAARRYLKALKAFELLNVRLGKTGRRKRSAFTAIASE